MTITFKITKKLGLKNKSKHVVPPLYPDFFCRFSLYQKNFRHKIWYRHHFWWETRLLKNFSSIQKLTKISDLRVVKNKESLFLKSLSERVGSDLQRHWNWISTSTQNRLKMTSFKFIVVVCRIRLFPTLILKIKWLGSALPLTLNPTNTLFRVF